MSNILSYLFLFPLLIAFMMLFIRSDAKQTFKSLAFATTLIQFILSLILAINFSTSGVITSWAEAFQFVEKSDWITMDLGSAGQLNIDYHLGVDGIALPLVVLSTFILFIGVISSWSITEKVKGYFILYLVLASSIIGCFISLDFFLFYLCFEFMLLPMFFLIGIWGGKRRSYASVKFFLYTLLGSLFILIVMVGMYLSVNEDGANSFNLISMMEGLFYEGSLFDVGASSKILNHDVRSLAFIFLLIGFGIKLPMVPVHTWLPDAHVEAPTPISVILAGLLLKVGGFGFFRIAYGILPEAAIEYASWVAVIGVVSIIYGGLNALAQNDMKRLVAYSSVAHMGFVLVGLSSLTNEGASGALFHLVSHGLISPALFIIVGVIYDRTKNREIENFSGLASKLPRFTFFVIIFFFAGLGLPGFSGFVGELFVILGAFKTNLFSTWIGILTTIGIAISAAYFLWTIQRVFFGKYFVRSKEWETNMIDLTPREWLMLVPIALLVVLLGVYPRLVLDISSSTINFFVEQTKFIIP